MNRIVSVRDLHLSYNVHTGLFSRQIIKAVNGISFDLQRNEMLSLIGHNGSGKTTTLSIVAGILKPDSGEIMVKGTVVPFLGLGIGFNPELTGRENVFLYGAIMGFSRKRTLKIYDAVVEFSELKDYMNLKIKEFSTGMYVRLGFSVAIYTNPDILIIDEVLSVGDVHFQRKCLNAINNVKAKGTAIMFVSHDMGLVSRFSDRVILLSNGKIIKEGEPDSVIDEYMNMKENSPILQKSRRGSGEVEITNIEIDRESRIYNFDEDVTVTVRYKNNSRIKDGILGFAITDENGCLICGPNTKDYADALVQFSDEGSLSFSFKNVALNPGKYFLTLALYDSTNRFPYDHIDHADFYVLKGLKKKHLGTVKIPVKWNIK
ncbi:MAG: ABC transporter ATP-binding protein [bacterium]|nr:ABC transporter ATP-binding protein [bacterium]